MLQRSFHLQPFRLQTFVGIDSKSCQRSPSEVAVLFYWNLSRRHFLELVVDLDAALRRIRLGT